MKIVKKKRFYDRVMKIIKKKLFDDYDNKLVLALEKIVDDNLVRECETKWKWDSYGNLVREWEWDVASNIEREQNIKTANSCEMGMECRR